MNLDLSNWKRFSLGRLFDIKKGKRLTSEDQKEGDNLYIGAIDSNNGVANHIGQAPIHKGNTISLSYNGSVGEAFYQPEPYWATDDVNALYSKYDGFNEPIGLFIAATIRQEKYRFSYGRKWTLDNMKSAEICLPVKHNSDGTVFIDDTHGYSDEGLVPDWKFMEDYIKSLHHKPLATKNKPGHAPELNVSDWKEFRVGDLFDIQPTKGVVTDDLIEGAEVPYMAAKHDDNGIEMICQKTGFEDWISKGNCIVFVNLGAGSAGYANYIKEDFIGMSGKISCGYNSNLNEYNGLFVAAVLCQERPKYSFGRSWTGNRLADTIIKLPANADGNPDWQFMEDYIKSLPYGDRLEG